LVEGGLETALTRKHSPNSARKRIFDGVAEAKLIALACSPPPKGRKRWTLTLLETAVVELNIVDRASDNLSTHKPASLYEAFPPAEARRLVERFEWHYTPKHGSWLNMAESELSVLSGQCLDRRIPDKQTLIEEVAAWQGYRNKNHTKADWQFTTADARIKLKRLYPAI
jgi:hypothetical protein